MKRVPKILLVDDESDVKTVVEQTIGPWPELFYVQNADDFKNIWKKETFDLLLLDLNLGNDDGLKILASIKELSFNTKCKVFIITANPDIEREIEGHVLGVHEYIRKPFEPRVVNALIQKHLSGEMDTKEGHNFKKGPFELDRSSLSLILHHSSGDRSEHILTSKEYRILSYLMENDGRILSREQIFERVWDAESDGLIRNVDVQLANIRKKLGACKNHINTVRSMGYIFKSAV